VVQGKCIESHKANVQLYSAMKRQGRYLRTIDNPKIWKIDHSPCNPGTYGFSGIL